MPWYPRKREGKIICPVCDGTGTVIDNKTGKSRKCSLCAGTGTGPERGNAKVVLMSQKEIESIINAIKLTSK